MDIEPISKKESKPVKTSFLRKWGPALVAIFGVLAINVALLGPSGHKIPALNEQQIHARKLGEERIAAVLEMDFDPAVDRRMGRDFGSRNLILGAKVSISGEIRLARREMLGLDATDTRSGTSVQASHC